jgi:hypothetical protein
MLAAVTGATPALSGCGPNWMVEKAQREAYEEQQSLGGLLERARFELQCPDANLAVLERYQGYTDNAVGPATLAGVSGCGRQAMYKRRLRRRYGHGRTTDNTKWEPTTPNTGFAFPAAPSPAMPPPQYQPSVAPGPGPLPEHGPPRATPAPALNTELTPPSSPDAGPPARIFGVAH